MVAKALIGTHFGGSDLVGTGTSWSILVALISVARALIGALWWF